MTARNGCSSNVEPYIFLIGVGEEAPSATTFHHRSLSKYHLTDLKHP